MLGFGRAAREVCAIALRRRVCFGHLVSAKYECELEALSFSESKSASGSSYGGGTFNDVTPVNLYRPKFVSYFIKSFNKIDFLK